MPGQDALVITDIDIYPSFLEATVRCRADRVLVDARTYGRVEQLLPGVSDQLCVHAGHSRFGEEACGTELPHLLEHVAIELLVLEARDYSPDEQSTFLGATTWRAGSDGPRASSGSGGRDGKPRRSVFSNGRGNDGAGEFREMRVRLTFSHDLVALAALKHGEQIVRWACGERDEPPDVGEVIRGMHLLRER